MHSQGKLSAKVGPQEALGAEQWSFTGGLDGYGPRHHILQGTEKLQ